MQCTPYTTHNSAIMFKSYQTEISIFTSYIVTKTGYFHTEENALKYNSFIIMHKYINHKIRITRRIILINCFLVRTYTLISYIIIFFVFMYNFSNNFHHTYVICSPNYKIHKPNSKKQEYNAPSAILCMTIYILHILKSAFQQSLTHTNIQIYVNRNCKPYQIKHREGL